MSCTLTFECDACGEQDITDPLLGGHNELNVRVGYPEGWEGDDDMWRCQACAKKRAKDQARLAIMLAEMS